MGLQRVTVPKNTDDEGIDHTEQPVSLEYWFNPKGKG